MRKNLIFLLILLTCKLFGQEIYSPGYILDIKGDTIKGFILDDNSVNNFHYCLIKTNTTDKPIKYNANDIGGYRYIEGKYYVSKEIITDSVKLKVFLQWIIKGKINIYSFRKDYNTMQYFIETSEKGLIELKNTEIELIDQDLTKHIIQRKEYVGTLAYFMRDCQDMIPKINKSPLNDNALISLVKDYSDKVCYDQKCIIYQKPKDKIKFITYFSIGKNYSNIDLNAISLFVNNRYKIKESLSYGINFSFSNFNYINKSLSFQTGFNFEYFDIQLENKSEHVFNFVSIQIPFLIEYSFRIKNFEPYILMGPNLSSK